MDKQIKLAKKQTKKNNMWTKCKLAYVHGSIGAELPQKLFNIKR